MALDEEKLINLISQYTEIYDLQNEHYMNSIRKNNIWKEIGKEMGEKDIVCKEKWKSLSDGCHRNMKRRKGKSGDSASKCKKWKFESQMEFLRPHLQERATNSNIKSVAVTNISDDDINDNDENYVPNVMSTSPEPQSVNSPQSSRPSSSATSSMFTNITARKKKQTRLTQQSSVANVLQTYLDSRPVTTTPSIDTGNPIHSFFKAMADSVIALPSDLQLKVKNKVYAIVSDAEYEHLTRNSTSFIEQPDTHLTSRTQAQNIQDQQVQIVSDDVQHQIDSITNSESNGIPGRTNNESNIVVDFNPGPQITCYN